MLSAKLKEAAGNGIASTLYVDSVFSTWLYTGNGSTQTITNGIDLAGQGGLVWVKTRSTGTTNHMLTHIPNYYIASNSDGGISGPSASYVNSFNSNGFTGGSNTQSSGTTYASWTFRKAAKFFDVVTYTGTGSNRTIAHNLGIAPGMVIVKRTDTTGNWQVYSNGLTSAAYSIQLNLTNAQASAPTVWNSTAPTSSVFSVGTDATVNASGGTYVAYLFAHDTASDGIIQCGSFTTTADAAAEATINLGWEPQYVLLKSYAGGISNWYIFDTMRGWDMSGSDAKLFANTTDAETTATQFGNPTATGFYVRNLGANQQWIYMAIRRPNKPPTSGTQVFSPVYEGSTTPAVQTPFVVDMGISKRKDLASDVLMGSRLQGSRKMWTNLTNAESADANYTWDYQNGYKTNTGVSTGYNINWSFKRAPGFFDEVCYTGTGSATTQAHNLTVVPELIIVKERSAANDWWVYNVTVGNTKYSVLNSTAIPVTSSTAWNNTTPTSSVFSIGTGANVNASAQTYVAYLFATLAGISKVGSYTGNGSSQNIDCGFAAGARFFLVKATSTTGSWWVWDSARGIVAGNDPALQLNSTAAEITTADAVDPYSPGITVNQEATCSINASGVSYVYLAIS